MLKEANSYTEYATIRRKQDELNSTFLARVDQIIAARYVGYTVEVTAEREEDTLTKVEIRAERIDSYRGLMSNLAETLAKQQEEIEDLKRRLSRLESDRSAAQGSAVRQPRNLIVIHEPPPFQTVTCAAGTCEKCDTRGGCGNPGCSASCCKCNQHKQE